MKMPRRTKEIKLDGEYEGFEFTAVTSIPINAFSYFQTGNWDLIQSALLMILIDWNFVDENGDPLPQPQERIPALDPAGKPATANVKDEAGQVIQEPILVPAVSLIPLELGLIILEKSASAMTKISDP